MVEIFTLLNIRGRILHKRYLEQKRDGEIYKSVYGEKEFFFTNCKTSLEPKETSEVLSLDGMVWYGIVEFNVPLDTV